MNRKNNVFSGAAMLLLAAFLWGGCTEPKTNSDSALFGEFMYGSDDERYPSSDSGCYFDGQTRIFSLNAEDSSYYLNPILNGTYPDPSICRKGDDYYMVNSSFVYYPGVPCWHSRDLVHWEFIDYVLNRPSQLSFKDGLPISAGIYAPAISYHSGNDTFYMITTHIGGMGNFMVKTDDPRKGWSDPIRLPQVSGIDPSLFFDDNGKAYIVHNGGPAGKPEYDGHTAIWLHEFDVQTDQIVGEPVLLVDKGVNPKEKPIWIEGPHLYHVGRYYYLMAAEGGTGEYHSEVIFRSKDVKGPYRPCPINPILTQRDLRADRPYPITSTGHADLIQTAQGDWWAVFLGVCPYDSARYCNTGRSTFLLPVEWKNEQPIILTKGKVVPTMAPRVGITAVVDSFISSSENLLGVTAGNFAYMDYFDNETLAPGWLSLRGPSLSWSRLCEGNLEIDKRPVALSEKANPSFLCRWVSHSNFMAFTSLTFTPKQKGDMAGLAYFMNDDFYYAIGKTLNDEGQYCLSLERCCRGEIKQLVSEILPEEYSQATLYLKVISAKSRCDFLYSYDGWDWSPLAEELDAKLLSTAVAGGFTGATVGLFAVSEPQP